MRPVKQSKSGFTLIELLVVIAIIAILAAILFPVFAKAKENGRKGYCISTLKQYGTAFMMYADDNDGVVPVHSDYDDVRGWKAWGYYLWRYTDKKYLQCPSFKTSGWYNGYQMNANVCKAIMENITYPTLTPMLFDADGVSSGNPYGGWPGGGGWYDPDYRHNGSLNILMVDGHVVTKAKDTIDWSKDSSPYYWHFYYNPYKPK